MFGEEEHGESPRQPSPWQDVTPPIAWVKRPCSSAEQKAVESLRLAAGEINIKLDPESDATGHIEYKLRLAAPSAPRFQKLVTQLAWRLFEGGGEALYELGVLDSGELVGLPADELASSLETLERMCREVDGTMEILREVELQGSEVLVEPSSSPLLSARRTPPTIARPTSQRDLHRVHESDDFTGHRASEPGEPAALPIPVPFTSSATYPSNKSRGLRPTEILPAGTRYCVEVSVKKQVDQQEEPRRAFIDFENFSMSL